MTGLSSKQAYVAAAVSGVAFWLATSAVSGRREAWDSSLYWSVAYPLAIAVAGALGYLAPDRPWRWAATLMLVQAVSLAVAASSFGLLPLGLMLFGVLAVPPAALATVGARIRHRRNRRN
ncbi:MAG TPA: hypothetical protein VM820_08890 [Vicinamibacterales bacterium]|jgi:peptidoglycan/LPS O-acetylase OafA/YrhL|nr:hypothetical protein [Vicinamibacterales bacterium]